MTRTFLLFLICATVVSFSFFPVAHAGIQVYATWPSRDFNVYVDASCGKYAALIDDSFKRWQTGFQFDYQYTSNITRTAQKILFFCDNTNPPWEPTFNTYCFDSHVCTGLTESSFNSNGTINHAWIWFMNSPTIAWIPAHELGHTFGLGHSDQITDLMYPTTDILKESLMPSVEDFETLAASYKNTPIPEYQNFIVPMLLSMFVLVLVRGRLK